MNSRIQWIDQARALSIILVVMMHSTLGVEKAFGGLGWMNDVVSFATPFRIPAFFLVSGLLVATALRKPIGEFFTKRVITLFYLYIVWLTIQFGLKAPGMIGEMGAAQTVQNYLFHFVQPFGTLWFIYVLPLYFLIARAADKRFEMFVGVAAIILHFMPINTGWIVADAGAHNFVFFYAGHILARHFRNFASLIDAHRLFAFIALIVWGIVHGLMLQWASLPVVGTVMAFLGAAAIITVATLISATAASKPLGWIGRNTIVVYLGFFLPMAITRIVLLKTGIVTDIGTVSLIVSIAAVTGAIIMYWVAQKIGLDRYFYRLPSFVSKSVNWRVKTAN